MFKHMKWYGWGDPTRQFTLKGLPSLGDFITKQLGTSIDLDKATTPPIQLEEITLDPPRSLHPFLAALGEGLRPDQLSSSDRERILHSYGKSFRDLWRLRRGKIDRTPDLVIYPESEEDVIQVIEAAHRSDTIVIPFGGGSNIAGCLEARNEDERAVISLDMQKMNRLLKLDLLSHLATFQAGILGPELEKKLNEAGMTLGHFPDSFEYSSLGGWVATRSAGMQSDRYGKIEDMVISVRMITPQGKIVTRNVPKCSNGIDVNHLCIGSEGILGVITEVTLQIHRLPEKKEYGSFLFPDFERGVSAIYECGAKGITPSMTRLNDAGKTALSFAFKRAGSRLSDWLGKGVKFYLRTIKKMDFEKVSLLLVCFEGTAKEVKRQKKESFAIYRHYGAVYLGQKPGREFAKTKYDFPYIRDFLMDRGIIADVSETATTWANLLSLYNGAKKAIYQSMEPAPSFCGCHISHTYHTGASLYFTYACAESGEEVLAQYQKIKNRAEEAFIKGGATLSHHHAVGYEHSPWIEEEITPTGLKALIGLKKELDPQSIMNPGKIIPTEAYVLSK